MHDVGLNYGVLQPHPILIANQAVAENSAGFVHPQLRERLQVLNRDAFGHQHALKHLGHIAQVEGVVRLGGSRQKLLGNLALNCQGGRHHSAALCEFD